MGRPPKEKIGLRPDEEPGRLSAWPPAPVRKPEEDELAIATEDAVLILLRSNLEAKDMNAAIANAIRLLQLKHKLQPAEEEKSFWGDGDAS